MRPGLEIIFEDNDLLAINKPAGIHSAALPNGGAESISVALKEYLPSLSSVSKKAEDSGLINRLDCGTSGILIAAKSRKIWEHLRATSDRGEIKKHYLAIVEGRLDNETQVDNYIGARSRGSEKVKVFEKEPLAKYRALPARSLIRPVRYLGELDATIIAVTLSIGRRHQVRAHAAFLGHPLLGDTLYGAKRELGSTFGFSDSGVQFLLCANIVSLNHPTTDARLELIAPMPDWTGEKQAYDLS